MSTTLSKADCKIRWKAELRTMDGNFTLSSDCRESSSLGIMLALRSRPSNSDVNLREALRLPTKAAGAVVVASLRPISAGPSHQDKLGELLASRKSWPLKSE